LCLILCRENLFCGFEEKAKKEEINTKQTYERKEKKRGKKKGDDSWLFGTFPSLPSRREGKGGYISASRRTGTRSTALRGEKESPSFPLEEGGEEANFLG